MVGLRALAFPRSGMVCATGLEPVTSKSGTSRSDPPELRAYKTRCLSSDRRGVEPLFLIAYPDETRTRTSTHQEPNWKAMPDSNRACNALGKHRVILYANGPSKLEHPTGFEPAYQLIRSEWPNPFEPRVHGGSGEI